jgi:hypothetical protein
MKVSKQQRTIALVAGGLVLAYLLYRWMSNRQTSSASTGAAAPDTASGDYAALAGQEQGDIAALQGQNSQLWTQEQSDIAGLQSGITGLGTQETSDISGLTSQLAGFTDQFQQIQANEAALTGSQATIGSQISSLASGVTKLNRAQTASIQTHRNGPFYNYYVKVTGHKPPARVLASNFVYQAYKGGVKASALQAPKAHPSAKNTHVAHPNPAHAQRPAVKPQAPKPPPRPQSKPAGPKPPAPKPAARVAPKPPPKPTKPKASGVRR